MAKKRRDSEEEEDTGEMKFPEFDREEFLRDEVRDSKAILVSCVAAIPFGAIAVLATIYSHFAVGIIVGIAGLGVLKLLWNFAKVDTSAFKAKHWFFNGGTYFVTFIVFWVLLCNPPFADLSAPAIRDVKVVAIDVGGTLEGVNWTGVSGNRSLVTMPAGIGWAVSARVSDNVALAGAPVLYTSIGATAPIEMTYDELTGAWIYISADPRPIGQTLRIRALDNGGRLALFEFSVSA